MAWEEERVKLLLKLNKQQFSASQIAEKLGEGVTRNAVIGKLNRMGLSCGGGKPNARADSKNEKREDRGLLGNRRSAQAPTMRVVLQLQPSKEAIGIAELSDSLCRFPMGDPQETNFRFCGADKGHEGLPYCDYHTQLAHQRSKRGVVKVAPAQKQIIKAKQGKRATG